MKRITLPTLLLLFQSVLYAKPSQALRFAAENKGYCSFATVKKTVYCITQKAIYRLKKSELVPVLTLPLDCHEAAAYHDTILLATDQGIKAFDATTSALKDFIPSEIAGNITHVATDDRGAVWFTKEFEGCFTFNRSGAINKIINVPVTYSLAYTPDGIIWVGTNVGLYKVFTSGERIDRYAEEGVADKDLPDNLVEHLYPAAKKGVWAIMPGHISLIMPDEDDESADLENVGRNDNELYDIEELPERPQSFLFITSQGILYVPKGVSSDVFRIGEIHQNIKETAYTLSDDLIMKPASFRAETVNKIEWIKDKVYFVTNKGFWTVSAAKFAQEIKKNYSKT